MKEGDTKVEDGIAGSVKRKIKPSVSSSKCEVAIAVVQLDLNFNLNRKW